MRKNKFKTTLSVALVACIATSIMSFPISGCKPENVVNEGDIVTFDYNDSHSRPYSILVDENNAVSEPAIPQQTGYSFEGWFTEKEGGQKVEFTDGKFTVQSSTTLYAHWGTQQYYAYFDYNYENSPAAIEVTAPYNSTIEKPADPVRDDGNEDLSVFYRWETLPSGGVEVTFPYILRDNGVRFYAHWVKGLVNITFDFNYGEEEDAETQPASVAVRTIQDESFNVPSNLSNSNMMTSRPYFDFVGWAKTPDATTGLSTRDLRNLARGDDTEITLYALWKRSEYSIVFRNNYYGLEDEDARRFTPEFSETMEGVTIDGKVVTVIGGSSLNEPSNIPVREGYTFLGWYTDSRSLTPVTFPYTPTSSGSIYARWKSNAVETKIFDAEFVTFDPSEQFPGYSGAAYGIGTIQRDSGVFGATTQPYPDQSGQPAFVSYMYKENATLTFVINSSAATTATLYASLGSEFNRDYTLSPTGDNAWRVVVNGVDINYTPVRLNGADVSGGGVFASAFREFNLANIQLKEGENVIQLITANSNAAVMGGTMQAVAPTIDRIRLDTSATLTWSPVYDNLYTWTA